MTGLSRSLLVKIPLRRKYACDRYLITARLNYQHYVSAIFHTHFTLTNSADNVVFTNSGLTRKSLQLSDSCARYPYLVSSARFPGG